MKITEGLKIKEDQFIDWSVSFEELRDICQQNNIDYQLETGNILKRIVLSIEFANLGKVKASFCFINETIKEVYITKESETEFSIDEFFNIRNKLILYFGKPKLQNKKKAVWKFNKIQIKHFYIKRDDIVMDYLVLENYYL